MTGKLLASIAAAEALIIAAVVGIGAELVAPTTGILAFGVAWGIPVLIDRIRREP